MILSAKEARRLAPTKEKLIRNSLEVIDHGIRKVAPRGDTFIHYRMKFESSPTPTDKDRKEVADSVLQALVDQCYIVKVTEDSIDDSYLFYISWASPKTM